MARLFGREVDSRLGVPHASLLKSGSWRACWSGDCRTLYPRCFPGVASEDVPLWYGVIFMVNMQMAFLSPPFGYSLFYLKSVAPPEITMATIPRRGQFHGVAVDRRRIVYPIPADRPLAGQPGLFALR